MGKLYVPSKALTPLDRVREALDEAEKVLCNVRGAGPRALRLLHLFDQIAHDLEQLDAEDVDLRVERSRFEMIQAQLRHRKRRFLNEVSDDLKPAREQAAPGRSHWWWYLDEAATRQRLETVLRVGAATTAVIALLMVAYLAYRRFLAPPPSVGQAYRRMEAGQRLVEEGDHAAALRDFEAAADLTPQDPEPWLWQGVLYDGLNESDRAKDAFDVAQSLYGTTLDFYLNRGRIYLEAGRLEKAETDAKRAIAEAPTSGWPYYLRAGVDVRRGDYGEALAGLDRATELAQEAGDRQLEALARTQQVQVMRMAPLLNPTPSSN
jgi:tetratricopeptide (TPR) repeat protein